MLYHIILYYMKLSYIIPEPRLECRETRVSRDLSVARLECRQTRVLRDPTVARLKCSQSGRRLQLVTDVGHVSQHQRNSLGHSIVTNFSETLDRPSLAGSSTDQIGHDTILPFQILIHFQM